MHFVMQHFPLVSKNYLNFCLNYLSITNSTYINLSQRYRLVKDMFTINKLPSIITVFLRFKMFYHQGAYLLHVLRHLHCMSQRRTRTCILAFKNTNNKADSHHTEVTSSNKPSVTQLHSEFCVGVKFSFSQCTTYYHSLNFKNDQRPRKHDLRGKTERIGVV